MTVSLVQSQETINGTSAPALVGTFPSDLTEGNMMVALCGCRPGDNNPPDPTDALATGSVAGGTPWSLFADAETPAVTSTTTTASQRLSIYHRQVGASEGESHRYDPTSTQTNFRMILGLMEFGVTDEIIDWANAKVLRATTEPTAVSSYSLVSGTLPSEKCLAFGIATIRQTSTRNLTWHATNKPANDPFGEMEATNFLFRTGWEVVTSGFTWTALLDSASAPGAGILILVPVIPDSINNLRVGDATPSKLYVGDTEVSAAYKGADLLMGAP